MPAWVLWWRYFDPGQTRFMVLRQDELRVRHPGIELQHRWVSYPGISSQLKRAVIAAEDDKFVTHEGFDWEGIQKAMEKNLKRGKVVAGGSTISQQLAKNLFLSGVKTPWRKAQEALITIWLELFWDKRRILEIYLNVVEWGDGIFGAEAAGRRYFGVSAGRLSSEQAARLAVMLPAPRPVRGKSLFALPESPCAENFGPYAVTLPFHESVQNTSCNEGFGLIESN